MYAGSVLYRFIDYFIISASLLFVSYLYGVSFDKDYTLLLTLFMILYSYIGESLQLYRSWRVGKFTQMLYLLLLVQFLAFMLLISALFIFKLSETYSRVVVISWVTLSTCSLLSWRITARQIKAYKRKHGIGVQPVAILGMNTSAMRLYKELNAHTELGHQCIGIFDDRNPERLKDFDTNLHIGSEADAIEMAQSRKIKKLYICYPMMAEGRIQSLLTKLGDTTIDVLLLPDFMLKNLMHARIGAVGSLDTISVFESPMFGVRDFYKRTFDILFSLCVLLLISPLMLLIACAIKLTSKGPVLFKQARYGLDGERISVYKFRSMTVMENSNKVTQATKGDKRITKVGGFLRRTSLDELPQFFNVLLGSMSVVGPRPHAVAHNEEYRKQISYYMLRHKVKPGITGWAQVNGWRGETDTLYKMEKRIEYDLDYINKWSLFFDIKIIFLTLFKGFTGKNAY